MREWRGERDWGGADGGDICFCFKNKLLILIVYMSLVLIS